MKILVIGGTGLIGSKVVPLLAVNHTVTVASRAKGINAVTGEGLEDAMKGVDVVVDVSNSPSFEEKAVVEFFGKSGANIAAAEKKAGIKHHVALSVVGTQRLGLESGYFKGKVVQEKLIKESGVPYTILQATQFHEFIQDLVNGFAAGDVVRTPTGYIQPITAVDVAETLAKVAVDEPKGTVELAGPEKFRIPELIGKFLVDTGDKRKVEGDPTVTYFGVDLHEVYLVPAGANPLLGSTNYSTWFASSKFAKQ